MELPERDRLLQLSEEQAEQLGLSVLGDANREEQVSIKYRLKSRTENNCDP